MALSRFGLQGKIIFIIALAVISVVSVSTYIAMWLTRLPVEEEIYRKALGQARATARDLVDHRVLQNAQTLQRSLRQVQHDFTGVKQCDVYLHEPSPQLLATTDPRGEHLELDRLSGIEEYNEFERQDDQITIETLDGKFWIVSTPIRDQDREVGCLNLKISKVRANVITSQLVQRNVILMIASLAVVILVIHFFFLRRVRSPVREMIRVMEAAEGGQLDMRAHVASNDEIGLQAEHLNRMLARIENFNSELGHKVEEATAELERRNEELKRIYEELFETQKNLARSERLAVAGQLAASLAHEIGTPLNSISGHVQLLARQAHGNDPSKRRLQVIESQIENIVRTVKQLLSWTRKFDLRVEPLDLHHLVEEAVLIASPALELRKIKVRTALDLRCPPIQADPAYLQQVFLNMLNNSMDAMPGGGELRVGLRLVEGEAQANGSGENGSPGQRVAIEFADTGLGMTAETLAHIFEPMFTTKRLGTGAGLGLAICNQIVRQHGGAIEVQSELGRGTCFTIILPTEHREKAEASAAAAHVAAGSAS